MKIVLIAAVIVLLTAESAAAITTSYWTKRQAEQRIVSIVPKKVNPLRGSLRTQCAGFRPSKSNPRLFSHFSCILQRKDGSFLVATIRVLSRTRAAATNVSCVHYAQNTTGPRACRK